MEDLTVELEEKRNQLKELKKEIAELAVRRLEDAKRENKSFDEIFELWLDDDVPKKKYGWLINVNVKGAKDIWDYIDYGEPIRSKEYSIHDIVEQLTGYYKEYKEGERLYITAEQLEEFKRELMDQNVGSAVFDW